jgi:hypothetical protein
MWGEFETIAGVSTTSNSRIAASTLPQGQGYYFQGANRMFVSLRFDVSSAEESGVNGPCSGPDHCSSTTEGGQNDRNPRVVQASDSNPNFEYGNQRSNNWCPEANEKKYGGASRNHQWNRRGGKGCARKLEDPEADEQRSR